MIPWLFYIAPLVPKRAFGLFSWRNSSLKTLLNVRGEHMYPFEVGEGDSDIRGVKELLLKM